MNVLGAVKRANRKGKPEESIALRVAVLVAVVTAATALLGQGVGGPLLRVAATVGIAGGFAYSHHARNRPGYGLKAFLAFAVVVAFANFLAATSGIRVSGLNQVQIPLAELFLWVQVLHSLDVPARRDLLFSLMSSLVLIAVAGVLSVSAALAPYLAVWAVAAVVALVLAHRSDLADRPRLVPLTALDGERAAGAGAPRPVRTVVTAVALALAVACGLFLLLPAAGAGRAIAFPAELPRVVQVPAIGGLANPSLGGGDPASPDGSMSSTGTGSAAFGYFGFSNELDTGVRGRPDDTLVLRVKATRPDFWRGQTFDTWDGRVWRQSDQRVLPTGGELPIRLGAARSTVEGEVPFGGSEFVQTVYVERPGPNLVFGAYAPQRLYFRDNRVFEMSDGTLRAGVQLERGAVYTVVSMRPDVTAEVLRTSDYSSLADSGAIEARYGSGAPTVITPRVAQLAEDITADAPTRYDKVKAIEAWMAANTAYTLDIPPLPRDVDAVEQFLFADRKGFCEQIATSLVVMLRSLGIPARVAVGYAPGSRNPFTGMWEVRASDAHAWAEVWFPGIGWQAFDPTASVPLAGDPYSSSAAAGIVAYLKRAIPDVPPSFVQGAVAVLALSVVAFAAVALLRRRSGRAARPWADVMLERLERAGASRGRSRRTWESPSSYADTLARSVLPDARVRDVAATIERDAFSPAPLPEDERDALARLLDDIEAAHPIGSNLRV